MPSPAIYIFLLQLLSKDPITPAVLWSEATVFVNTKVCTQETLALGFLRRKEYHFQSLTSTSWRQTEGSVFPLL